MSELKENAIPEPKSKRRFGRSMFGPIFLITLGFFLLFGNLNMLPDLHWGALLQLWPLLLVFIGLNLLVRAVPHPIGTILSGIVALIAAGVVAFVLLFADEIPALADYSGTVSREVVREQVSYPADGVEAADVAIDFSSPSSQVFALNDSPELIEADVTHSGRLVFDTDISGGRASISLDTEQGNDWYYWLNPANWNVEDRNDDWRIGLNPGMPMDLDFNMGSGSADIDLTGLTLEGMVVDGGSGSVKLTFPDGGYNLSYDVGSGSVEVTLPEGGRHEFKLDGGSGSLTLLVPDSLEVRIELVDGGSGSLNIDERMFVRIEGDGDDDGSVWQTESYEDSANRVNILLDIGSGSVSIDSQ